MKLITMAHLGEAQGAIETFKLKRVSPHLYRNEEIVLLLTGEGPFEAATKTALVIPKYPIKEIINIGIAGSLTSELKVGDFVPVRTHYLINGFTPAFKTFQSHSEGVDCLTSFERILDPKKAQSLRGMGKLVDREAWGVAMAARTAERPMRSYKLVSDNAGSLDACELVKGKALEFSLIIADKLSTILSSTEDSSEESFLPQGFHFTFSTRHQFKNLLKKLTIKDDKTSEDILENFHIQELRQLDILPKERTKILLTRMENAIDPVRPLLEKTREELTSLFLNKGVRIHIDPTWEKSSVTLTLEAATDQELSEKAEALMSLSIASFTKIMQGELDVE
ncbi:MAG: hypothetical protein ACLGHN_00135 [Bacteriovoracia bacterium]